MGPVRPAAMQQFDSCDEQPTTPIAQNLEAVEALTKIEHNLERLTLDIPDIGIDDLPLRYQRHTLGVSGLISRLLR